MCISEVRGIRIIWWVFSSGPVLDLATKHEKEQIQISAVWLSLANLTGGRVALEVY